MPKRLLDKRWPWLVAAAAIVLTFLVANFELRFGPSDRRPVGSADDIARLKERADLNVLFILVDMLRADHLGSYGYGRDTSPELDQIATSGARFARWPMTIRQRFRSEFPCVRSGLWSGPWPVWLRSLPASCGAPRAACSSHSP